jgi:hypothetical protein
MGRGSRGLSPALDQFSAATSHVQHLELRGKLDTAVPETFRGDKADVAMGSHRVVAVGVRGVGQDHGDDTELVAI